jgi:predicted NBD/HSP70 family sugar kinase
VTSAAELGHTADRARPRGGRRRVPGDSRSRLARVARRRAARSTASRERGREARRIVPRPRLAGRRGHGHGRRRRRQGGDADALRVLDILGERLGIGIANAINLFDRGES